MATKEELELKIVRLFDEFTHIPPNDREKRDSQRDRIQELAIQYKKETGEYINVHEARKRVYR